PSRERSSPMTGFRVARPLMNPTSPSSAPVTISPAFAPRLWQASAPELRLQPVSVSVRDSRLALLYSPAVAPPVQVTFEPPVVSSVAEPTLPVIFGFGPGPERKLYSPLPLRSTVQWLPAHSPVCGAGAWTQRPIAGSATPELNSASAGRPMFPCSSIARIAT